jgi:hypothetical protein
MILKNSLGFHIRTQVLKFNSLSGTVNFRILEVLKKILLVAKRFCLNFCVKFGKNVVNGL